MADLVPKLIIHKIKAMRLSPFFICMLLIVKSCGQPAGTHDPVYSGNPLFDGWYADPASRIYNDTFWIFPTYSDYFHRQVYFDCFSSPDLINWTKHERIIDTTEVQWADSAMWAPASVKKDGKYYFFFAANDMYEGDIGGIGVAVSDRPEGPYKDLLGKPLIGEIVNGAQPIDQYVFQDTDGTYYMYYGGWGRCNVVRLNDDFTGLVPFDDGTLYREVTPENYVEGPFMFIRDGKYYFMWSEGNWTGPHYRVAYAISDNPFGPFERKGIILQQDPEVARGAGHHSVLEVPGEDEYYIIYHRRPLEETHQNHRVVCIERLEFDSDGNIKPVRITFEGVAARTLTGR
jgi:beta-xylosidase